MTATGIEADATLGTTFAHSGDSAVAIRVFCSHTIAHIAMTAHIGLTQFSAEHSLESA